jgi:glycine cleavage system H lipoate-binding protein
MSLFLQKSFRLFHPAHHLWLRATPIGLSAGVKSAQTYCLEIGLTQRGLDDIGDMTLVMPMVQKETHINEGHDLLRIEWEGHSITSADELYHTVWDSFSGTTPIASPVSGTVNEVNVVPPTSSIDEDTVLVKVTATEQEWESAQKIALVKEPEYMRILRSIPPGKFADA